MNRGITVILLAALVAVQAPVAFMQENVDETIIDTASPRSEVNIRQQHGSVSQGLQERISFEEVGLKNRVQLASSRMAEFIRNLVGSIQRSQGLSDQEKNQLTGELSSDMQIIQSEAAKTTIAGTSDALRKNIERIREFWISRVSSLRQKVGRLLIARVEGAKNRFERLDAKVTLLKERLQENDIPTDEIERLQNELREEVADIDVLISEATDLFGSITSDNEDERNLELFQSGVEKLREAHALLSNARDTFRELLGAVRTAVPQLPDSNFSTTTPPSNS